nr:protein phosphatase 1 regulatory subunit 3D-like [Camelus dromedarius]
MTPPGTPGRAPPVRHHPLSVARHPGQVHSLPTRRAPRKGRAPAEPGPAGLQRAAPRAPPQALAQVDVFKASDHRPLLHVLSQLAINSDLCCSSQDLAFHPQCLVPDLLRPQRLSRSLCARSASFAQTWASAGRCACCNMAWEKQVAVHYTSWTGGSLGRGDGKVAQPWRRGHLGLVSASASLCCTFLLQFSFHLHFATALQGGQRRVLGQPPRRDCSLT